MAGVFTLGKTERLKSRKLIEQLFSEGRSFAVFPYRVFYLLESRAPGIQAGFGVSIKNFKKAVDRNRIKRLTRESYRLQKNHLQAKLMACNIPMAVFFIFTAKELPAYPTVFGAMSTILGRLGTVVDEAVASRRSLSPGDKPEIAS